MVGNLQWLYEHAHWADTAMHSALVTTPGPPAEPLREFNHILAADDVWLARIQDRPARVPIWPDLSLTASNDLMRQVHADYAVYVEALVPDQLGALVHYTNSRNQAFDTSIGDILHHVVLHAQYHRGKVNLLLRQHGCKPVTVDFIAWARGAPAADTSHET